MIDSQQPVEVQHGSKSVSGNEKEGEGRRDNPTWSSSVGALRSEKYRADGWGRETKTTLVYSYTLQP